MTHYILLFTLSFLSLQTNFTFAQESSKIGGAILQVSDLQRVLDHPAEYVGVILKINNPRTQNGVDIELYGAVIDKRAGIKDGQKFNCTLSSCSINKTFRSRNLTAYQFEHCAQFQLFDPNEPFISYFERGQLEMLLSYKNIQSVLITSYQVMSANPQINTELLEPNINFEMQPYSTINWEDYAVNKDFGGYGMPGTIRGHGCPRTWRSIGF